MNWLPIETAPRDFGITPLDLWNGERVADAWWGRPSYGDARDYGWVHQRGYDCDGPVDEYVTPGPTHWMPLPPPPEATP